MLYLASCTVLAMQDWPTDFQKNCTVVDNYDTRASMVPKKWPTGLPLNGYSLPMDDPPSVPGAHLQLCHAGQEHQGSLPLGDARKMPAQLLHCEAILVRCVSLRVDAQA